MCTNESYVSPYLRRPRRSYAEVIRDTGVKTAGATGREGGFMSIRVDDEGAASGIPKAGSTPGGRGAALAAPPPAMTIARLEREIDALADLTRAELVEGWRTHYRTDPPKGTSRRLLVRAIAYEMQAKRYGGLKPATDRRLRMIANGIAEGDHGGRKASPRLQPGARLVREWNGVSHVVEVIEGGFIWNGDRHRSLSAIARAITGARWSGPRFFGLASGDVP